MVHTANARVAPIVRKVLWADAVLELILGFILLGLAGDPAGWLGTGTTVTFVAALVFVAAAVGVGVLAWLPSTSPETVRYLAFANIAGGVAVWGMTLLRWNDLTVEGRTLTGAAADAFILVGVLELVALARTRDG